MKTRKSLKVVLLNAPFFRFCGSHNDRMPVSLTYMSKFLEDAGIEHVVFNGDYTGSQTYWRWKWMFDNFESFKDAVDGRSSLYGEIVEQVMNFSPDVVVIMAGEPLFSTTDLGNPFIAANFSKMFRDLGVFTVGYGPFFTVQSGKFKGDFDCLIVGEPTEKIVDIIRDQSKGISYSGLLSGKAMPSLKRLYPASQKTDSLMTSFGCAFNCSFCFAKQIRPTVTYVEMSRAKKDLEQRLEKKLYLGDLNFTLNIDHLKKVARLIKRSGIKKEFVVESRADTVDVSKINLLKKIGVSTVKIGLEGATDNQLKVFNKKTTPEINKRAVELLKEHGLKVVGYFIIGGPGVDLKDYEINLNWLKGLGLDFLVVNIWSYDFRTDYRYDTHFSPVALQRWKVPKEIFYHYLDLQQSINPTVGNLIG